MIITSKENKIYKFVRKLSEKKFRDECGAFIVEGARAVADVVAYRPGLIDSVLVAESKTGTYENEIVFADELFARLSETVNSQGVLAVLKKPAPSAANSQHALYLDGIRDPGNLGTLIRTACAAGYHDVYLRGCADPYAGKVVRSTMSAIVKVNLIEADENTLSKLKSDGYTVFGADMDGRSVFGYAAPHKFCLIIGGEADGITECCASQCDVMLSIPMDGQIESLNAAVSGAVMMYTLKFQQVR